MADAFNRLGTDILINAIVYASDVDEVQTFIIRELARRGLGAVPADSLTPERPAANSVIQHIYSNCRTAGYSGTSPSAQVPTASEIKAYIAYAKQLYTKILRP